MAFMCLLISGTSLAQISSFRLQASGLTCALCARSIHKNLESVSWISKVETDLEKSEFVIRIKPDMPVDADQITKKVEDAGFGVASLIVNARIPHAGRSSDRHLTVSGMPLHIISDKAIQADEEISLRLIDKPFLGPKDQRKFAKASRHACFQSGKASGQCCNLAGIPEGNRIFHVVI